MTFRRDINRMLTGSPSDWEFLLVYADWLEERGSELAEGLRKLVVRERHLAPSTFGAPSPTWERSHLLCGNIGDAWSVSRGVFHQLEGGVMKLGVRSSLDRYCYINAVTAYEGLALAILKELAQCK